MTKPSGLPLVGPVAGGFIEPCNPTFSTKAPFGRQWIHEIKHDGYRLIVRKDGHRVRLFKAARLRLERQLSRDHNRSAISPRSLKYHAVPTNSQAVVAFRTEIARRCLQVLIRRSERTNLNWEQLKRLIEDWLPKPRILHPWPDKFAVRYSR